MVEKTFKATVTHEPGDPLPNSNGAYNLRVDLQTGNVRLASGFHEGAAYSLDTRTKQDTPHLKDLKGTLKIDERAVGQKVSYDFTVTCTDGSKHPLTLDSAYGTAGPAGVLMRSLSDGLHEVDAVCSGENTGLPVNPAAKGVGITD